MSKDKSSSGGYMDNGIAEAIKFIADLAEQAKRPRTVRNDSEPAHVYWLQQPTGLTRIEAAPPPIAHEFYSIESLAGHEAAKNGHSIWYSRTGVTMLFNAERRDQACIQFGVSPQLEKLCGMASAPARMDQKAILMFLRVDMAGCYPTHPGLVHTLRAVKWIKKEEGSSATSQGKASLGRSIEAAVTGIDDIPDELYFDLPVFAGYGYRAVVPCVLDATPDDQGFKIRPIAGSIEAAFCHAESMVGDDLRTALGDSKVPVFYGTP